MAIPHKKSMRGRIRAYRKSGAMFGQTFHTGTSYNESPTPRKRLCAMMEVERWFRERHQPIRDLTDTERRLYAREAMADSIARCRDLRAQSDT